MQIGKLRHRIILQTETETRDAAGGVTLAWSTAATVWARIEPQAAAEIQEADAVRARMRYRVTIRYRSGLTTRHRIAYGDMTLSIDGITNPEERDVMLVLDCVETEVDASGSGSGSGTGTGA